MTISKRLRYEILRRDEHTCRYCGGTVPDVVLTVDHVIPLALGGTDEPGNLVAACKDCNAGKSADSPSSALVSDVLADSLRWSAAMQVAAGLALDEIEKTNAFVEAVNDAWMKWGNGVIPRPGDWSRSVRNWYSIGVPVALITDAIDLAMTNRRIKHPEVWRYACGIVWKRVTQMREDASRHLREEGA